MSDNQERRIVITHFNGEGIIESVFPSDDSSLLVKSVIGSNYDEIIEEIHKMRDFSFAYDFYREMNSSLNAEQCKAIRTAVADFADAEDLLFFYMHDDPKNAKDYFKKIMQSKDLNIISRFFNMAHVYLECSDFEEDLFSIDPAGNCKYLVKIAILFPKLNKDKVQKAIVKAQDFESLVEFYDYSGKPDFEKIVDMAVKSQNAVSVFQVAKYVSQRSDLTERHLKRLEDRFLAFCDDSGLFYEYVQKVGCINKERFIDELIYHKGTVQLLKLYFGSNWLGKKMIYQHVMKSGDNEMKKCFKKEASIINRILWSILK